MYVKGSPVTQRQTPRQGTQRRASTQSGRARIWYLATADEPAPARIEQIEKQLAAIRRELGNRKLKLMFEPGRSIAANAGLLVTRVEYLKPTPLHNFALVDAAMNDMIRPALYQAWLDIQPARPRSDGIESDWDVVGPVCETGDFLGKDRNSPSPRASFPP